MMCLKIAYNVKNLGAHEFPWSKNKILGYRTQV